MKCCGSRTTSTVLDPAPVRAERRGVAAQFEALLLQAAFAPLAKAIGFYGDAVVAAAAQSMTRAGGDGLTGSLDRAIESAARDAARR